MKALITGGCGFIGSHIVEKYATENNEVVIIDNLSKEPNNFSYIKENFKNIKIYQEDIKNINTLRYIIRILKPDVIFHTAGQTAVTTSLTNPFCDFTANVVGTVNLLECVRSINIDPKIVFCSTNKVYGNIVNDCPINETWRTDINPFTPYGASKNCADLYAREYAKTYGLKIGVFRMSCIYGIRQYGTEDQGWVAHFIRSSIQGKPITIYGDGNQVRDLLYITDLINAYDLFVKSNIKSGVWNVGGGFYNTISLLELLDLLLTEFNLKTEIKREDWRPNDQKCYISDITKVFNDLQWEPIIDVKTGVRKLLEFFKK